MGTWRVREQAAADVEREVVGRSEQAVEQDRPLEEAVERVVGGEADAGEHLLAVRRDGAGGAPGDGLRERRGLRPRFVGRGRERGVERLDRDEGVGEPVAHRLEPRDRAAELHPLDRVRPREVEHGAARADDLVRDGPPAERDRGVPRGRRDRCAIACGRVDAHDVEACVGIDAVDGRDVAPSRPRPSPHTEPLSPRTPRAACRPW